MLINIKIGQQLYYYPNLFVESRDIRTKEVVQQLLARKFGSATAASGGERQAKRCQSHLPPEQQSKEMSKNRHLFVF